MTCAYWAYHKCKWLLSLTKPNINNLTKTATNENIIYKRKFKEAVNGTSNKNIWERRYTLEECTMTFLQCLRAPKYNYYIQHETRQSSLLTNYFSCTFTVLPPHPSLPKDLLLTCGPRVCVVIAGLKSLRRVSWAQWPVKGRAWYEI